MNSNILPSDRAVLVATIDPDAYTANNYTSDYVHMGSFESVQACLLVGTIESSGTVDMKLVQATDSSGTGSKDITGKAITQLTQAGSDSDKQAIINVRSDELDVANGFDYVAATLTIGTANCDAGVVLLGHDARYAPGTDLSTADEIVD